MKKWEKAEINSLDISMTEHEWKIQPSLDGGYFGDGEISGWFGKDNSGNKDKDKGSSDKKDPSCQTS